MKNYNRDEQRAAYDRLPQPARAFLASTEYGDLMQSLGQKYGLHVDVVGQLSEAVSHMLLGFVSPAQFQDELKGMGIPDATIVTLIQDLNEKMFKPLQEKIRNAPPEEPAQEEEEEPTPPAPVSLPIQQPPVPPRPQPLQPSAPTAPLMPPVNVAVKQIPPTPATPLPPSVPEPAPELIQEQKLPEMPPLFVSPAPTPAAPPQPIQPPPPISRPTSQQTQQNRDALRQVLEGYKGTDPYRETPE